MRNLTLQRSTKQVTNEIPEVLRNCDLSLLYLAAAMFCARRPTLDATDPRLTDAGKGRRTSGPGGLSRQGSEVVINPFSIVGVRIVALVVMERLQTTVIRRIVGR